MYLSGHNKNVLSYVCNGRYLDREPGRDMPRPAPVPVRMWLRTTPTGDLDDNTGARCEHAGVTETGYTPTEIAREVRCDPRTIRRYLANPDQLGIELRGYRPESKAARGGGPGSRCIYHTGGYPGGSFPGRALMWNGCHPESAECGGEGPGMDGPCECRPARRLLSHPSPGIGGVGHNSILARPCATASHRCLGNQWTLDRIRSGIRPLPGSGHPWSGIRF